jgi:zinc transport system substrate-binding protein
MNYLSIHCFLQSKYQAARYGIGEFQKSKNYTSAGFKHLSVLLRVSWLFVLVLAPGILWSGGTQSQSVDRDPIPVDQTVSEVESPVVVVASTSWTAGFAYLAGAQDIHILAPIDLRHPPEYELRPSDMVRVSQADVIIFGGYERMVGRLIEASQNHGAIALEVATTYTREMLEQGVMAIAQVLGTETSARENLDKLFVFMDQWAEELTSLGLQETSVVAHQFQRQLLEDLGVKVVASFGPGPLEAQTIGRIRDLNPGLLVDNWHNPVAQPLSEVLPGVPVVELINFPGTLGADRIPDVFRFNRNAILEALKE